MSDQVSMAEAMGTLREVSLHSENADVQKHALDLLHSLSVFQELKYWSSDILRSHQSVANKVEAFVNLRVVGAMALKTTNPPRTVEEIGIKTGLLSSLFNNNGHAVTRTPDFIKFTPNEDSFSKAEPSQALPLIVRSPDSNPNQLYYASSPSPLRKSLTVSQATQRANLRRSSRDKGKEVDRLHNHSESSSSSESNLLGLLHETSIVLDVPAEPSASPNPPAERKKGPNWIEVNGWHMDLNDEETSSYFSNATNTIAKIMDMPTYGANLKEAEAAVKTNEEFDPTKDTPAAINALFATDSVLANRLWGTAGEDSTKSTILEAPAEIKVPALQDPPKRRKVSSQAEIPQITVTEPLNEPAAHIEALRKGSGLHDLSSVPSILDFMPAQPYDPTLPLPPVPTHPQTFKYTPTVIPPFLRNQARRSPASGAPLPKGKGKAPTQEQEIDWDVFLPQFTAMLQANKTPHTIPKTHENPIIAAELAMLHAQTILPRGCNPAYKEVCPCELSGRECPFKITCSLKRCYHKNQASDAGVSDYMHPTIRPSCVAWLRGDADCGHTEEEKVNGEFGHEDKATRDWQGGDIRIRLHLVWNI